MSKSELIRINKYIAQCGVASRRKADQLIESGEVSVNGKKIRSLGIQVDAAKDKVTVSGKVLKPKKQNLYIMFHKPKATLSSMKDPEGRRTVQDFFKHLPTRVFPVGRLDWNTEGLLILTNDGDFSQKVTHPKHEINKTYITKIEGKPEPEKIQKLLKGVTIPGGKVRAKEVKKLRKPGTKHTWYKIVISEGKYRQIKHMFAKIGYDVLKLQRVSIGNLQLGTLDKGAYRILTPTDLKKIFASPTKRTVRKKRQASKKRP